MADKAATEATELDDELIDNFVKYPISFLKRKILSEVMQNWQQDWDNGETGRQTYFFLPKVTLDIQVTDSRITQVLTGHGCFPYNIDKYNLDKNPMISPYCVCGKLGD